MDRRPWDLLLEGIDGDTSAPNSAVSDSPAAERQPAGRMVRSARILLSSRPPSERSRETGQPLFRNVPDTCATSPTAFSIIWLDPPASSATIDKSRIARVASLFCRVTTCKLAAISRVAAPCCSTAAAIADAIFVKRGDRFANAAHSNGGFVGGALDRRDLQADLPGRPRGLRRKLLDFRRYDSESLTRPLLPGPPQLSH